jgi:hypothetical protein
VEAEVVNDTLLTALIGLGGSLVGALAALGGTWLQARETRRLNAEERAEQRLNEHERELRQAYLDWVRAVEILGWELLSLRGLVEGKPGIPIEDFEQRYASTVALAATKIYMLDSDPEGHKLVRDSSRVFRERMMAACNPNTPQDIRVRLIITITEWLDTVFADVNVRFTGIRLPVTKRPSLSKPRTPPEPKPPAP